MILRLNTTEFLDWAEGWCFRCAHDHGFSHVPENDAVPERGCQLLLGYVTQTDVPEFEARHSEPFMFIPAEVSCSRFSVCTECPDDPPDAERRGGETHREFHDRLRNETLFKPVVVVAE